MTVAADDVRFSVPIYTSAEAARCLDMSPSTFASWVKGYTRVFPDRPAVTGAPLITGVTPEYRGGPSIPFGGLAEGMFLAALRRTGMPLQQIRPALDLVREKVGVDHALASRRLYVAGAQLLWEVSSGDDVDPETRETARDLIVLKGEQYVFRSVIERYLHRITYDDDYATQLDLPGYDVATIRTNPRINFGKPYFAHTGTPVHAVRGMLRGGDSIADVADDFGIPIDEVTEFAQRERLLAA